MLQEFKKLWVDKKVLPSFIGGRKKDWVFSPAKGSAGGMLIGRRADLFEVRPLKLVISHSVNLSIRDSGFPWWLCCVSGIW